MTLEQRVEALEKEVAAHKEAVQKQTAGNMSLTDSAIKVHVQGVDINLQLLSS